MVEARSYIGVPDHVDAARVFDFDMYNDSRLMADIHEGYAAVQSEAPDIFYTSQNGGHWVVTRYDLMSEIVRDHEHFSATKMQIPPVENGPTVIPLNLDPPESVPYRQLLAPWFTPKAIRALDDYLKEFATELVDRVALQGKCDFLGDISGRYPVGVFMQIFGLPMERFEEFRTIVVKFFDLQGQPEVIDLMNIINAELKKVMEQRRLEPRDDLLTYLLNAQIKGRPLTDEELESMTLLLFTAGLDTVTNALTFGIRHIAMHPEIQERLRAEPEKIGDAVDEVLRLFGVVNVPRVIAKDCTKFGVSFRQGDMLLNLLPMAGHDPRKNADPDIFNLDREKREHLAFSTGPHLCLGHFLARSEMKILFTEWFSRIPEFKLADGFRGKFRGGTVMSLESLELEWDAASAK